MPDSKAKREWERLNTTFIGLKLNNRQDADILAQISGRARQTEIKRLLRLAMETERK
jgi:hypothetical protein